MDKRELIRTNGLESPYRIVKGQRLLVRPLKTKSSMREEMDESEMPATEEVGNVSEDDEVQVKPLAAVSALGAGAMAHEALESGGRMNPEVDDEAEAEPAIDNQDPSQKGKYDDDDVGDEDGTRRPKMEQSSGIPAAPPAASGYTWPAQGNVTRDFSPAGKGKAQNDGINIAAAKGSPVVAANNGVVAHAGNQLRGFGNVVLVKHDNGTMTVYAHLDKVAVKKGEVVNAGQKIGTVGQTGTVKEPQLHFEIRKGRKPINPNNYLK
ncbi:MAG: M23 family metallopeptidase [Alphaproteobacteria bacterium]|nr:M23 family metallopeptidase [Alphaproteobacteria bacterium]